MFTQLTLGTIVTVACVMFHIGGLVVLLDWLNRITPRIERQFEHLPGTFMLIVAAVLGIILLHTIEVWSWALLYMSLGEFESLTRALYFSVATATTVGYGDVTPKTIPGRFIAFIDMLVGIGVLTLLTATVASILVEKKISKDLGMHSYSFEDHIILCEWNYRAEIILKELRLEQETEKTPIVLVADIARKPVKDKYLYFVKGEVCDETLHQANLMKAKTVIILGDDNVDYKQRDAKVILSVLTVESINKDAYTIAELINEKNIETCKRAYADEIIVSSKLSSNLISSATINHGISKVISDKIGRAHV